MIFFIYVLIIGLTLGLIFIVKSLNENETDNVKSKVKYYNKYSETFRKKVKEARININYAELKKSSKDGKELRKIINVAENNKEIQSQVENTKNKLNERLRFIEERLKEFDFHAFNNLDIILELKKRDGLLSLEMLKNTILKLHPNTDISDKVTELLKFKIVEKVYNSEMYNLNTATKYILHPYKTDNNGKPLIIETDLLNTNY